MFSPICFTNFFHEHFLSLSSIKRENNFFISPKTYFFTQFASWKNLVSYMAPKNSLCQFLTEKQKNIHFLTFYFNLGHSKHENWNWFHASSHLTVLGKQTCQVLPYVMLRHNEAKSLLEIGIYTLIEAAPILQDLVSWEITIFY